LRRSTRIIQRGENPNLPRPGCKRGRHRRRRTQHIEDNRTSPAKLTVGQILWKKYDIGFHRLQSIARPVS
jgi:hypothetical protein